jgi:phosphoglycerate dehydrogenase-like enzyme
MSKQVIFFGADPQSVRDIDKQAIEKLGANAGYEVIITGEGERFNEVVDRVVIASGTVPRERLADAPALQWFQQFGTGSEWLIPMTALRQNDLVITNVSDNHYNSLAEHILALIFALTRQLHHAVRAQADHAWFNPNWNALPELRGMVLLLAGVGSVGRRVAEMAAVFGIVTIGLRRNPNKGAELIDRCVSTDQLLAVLPEADIVANSLPLTPDTEHFFNADAFSAMKKSAIFVNVGRGRTVDQAALIAALQNGELGAAGLDVFAKEPLPQDSPLWDMDNVILTGHYAGGSATLRQRFIDVFVDNLKRFLHGEPLRNIIDKEHCY